MISGWPVGSPTTVGILSLVKGRIVRINLNPLSISSKQTMIQPLIQRARMAWSRTRERPEPELLTKNAARTILQDLILAGERRSVPDVLRLVHDGLFDALDVLRPDWLVRNAGSYRGEVLGLASILAVLTEDDGLVVQAQAERFRAWLVALLNERGTDLTLPDEDLVLWSNGPALRRALQDLDRWVLRSALPDAEPTNAPPDPPRVRSRL